MNIQTVNNKLKIRCIPAQWDEKFSNHFSEVTKDDNTYYEADASIKAICGVSSTATLQFSIKVEDKLITLTQI